MYLCVCHGLTSDESLVQLSPWAMVVFCWSAYLVFYYNDLGFNPAEVDGFSDPDFTGKLRMLQRETFSTKKFTTGRVSTEKKPQNRSWLEVTISVGVVEMDLLSVERLETFSLSRQLIAEKKNSTQKYDEC